METQSARAYTLLEINTMRASIRNYKQTQYSCNSYSGSYGYSYSLPQNFAETVEEELRTLLIGNADPQEVVKKHDAMIRELWVARETARKKEVLRSAHNVVDKGADWKSGEKTSTTEDYNYLKSLVTEMYLLLKPKEEGN